MGLQAVPGFIGQAAYEHPVELFRNITEALTAGGTGLLGNASGFALTPSGAAMNLTVAAGYAVIAGVENASQGSYFAWSDASEVLPWPAHGGSNRMDTLLLRIIDTQYGTDPDTPQAEWEIITGTSAVAIPDSEFLVGGDFYRPGAWWRVADVLVQTTDLVMTATDITSYLKMASLNDQRVNAGALFYQTVQFTSGGTFTKANYPNLKKIRVRCQAGGGGGGGAGASTGGQHAMGGGGGGGAYAESWIDAGSLSTNVTVTVGASAAGGVGANVGTNGNASSFGTAVVCPGGTGGSNQGTTAIVWGGINGGSGGVASAGDVRFGGGGGSMGSGGGTLATGGSGGNGYLGGGGAARGSTTTANGAGDPGQNYGGGGGGAFSNNGSAAANGGAGAQGIVLVDVYV